MEWLKNKYVQLVLALAIGITIGAVFYPTSEVIETTEKRVQEKYEEQLTKLKTEYSEKTKELAESLASQEKSHKEYQEEVSSSKSSYEATIRDLKSKVTERTYKLIKPDGTIVEKTFKESETEEHNSYVKTVTEEFNRKVKSIEDKWMTIHKKRVETVKEESETKYKELYDKKYEKLLEEKSTTITKTNSKKYNVELGYTTDQEYYLHTGYTLWGPLSVGAHADGARDLTGMSFGMGLGISF